MSRIHAAIVLVCLIATFPETTHGRGASGWSASTGEELAAGTLDGVAIDAGGRVTLAPSLETVWGPDEGIVWAVAPGSGNAAIVALSGPGRVLRVAPGGSAVTLYEVPGEGLVTTMIAHPEGGVVAGLSPSGRVVRIGEAGGESLLAETGSTFVWALARDTEGTLWVGTGLPGRLLRLREGDAPETVFDAGDDPVRCIAARPGGGVVFGTGGRGRVLRVDGKGDVFALWDAIESEIVSLTVDREGRVHALAARGQKQPSSVAAPRNSQAATEAGAMRVVVTARPDDGEEKPEAEGQKPSKPAEQAQKFKAPGGGALYRIDPGGDVRELWRTETEMPFALAPGPNDTWLVGTGDQGRIWSVDGKGDAGILLRVPSNQASAMIARADGHVWIGGTTDARVELLGAGPAPRGVYMTPAIDAGTIADWGRVRWTADLPRGAGVEIQVRSGNTEEPDGTWSSWRRLDEKGDAGTTGLPRARWFQARATLTAGPGGPPLLRRIDVRYQGRNRPPVIQTLDVEPPGIVWMRGPVQSSTRRGPLVADDPVAREARTSLLRNGIMAGPLRKAYEAGTRTLSWSASDPDEDRLRYGLEVRREGEARWFPLAAGLEDTFFAWDVRGLPDGHYRVRLTAEDGRDNDAESSLSDRRESRSFLVDNTPPELGAMSVRREEDAWLLRFDATDRSGVVAAAEVALGPAGWTPLAPVDGVADSEKERFELRLGGAGPEGVAIRVRVSDEAGNLASALWRVPDR